MKNGDIRFHKKLNNVPVTFGKEVMLNIFYGIIKRFNKMREPGVLEMSKKELWELMGFDYNNYQSEYLKEILESLTQSNQFKIDDDKYISGSIFTTKLEGNIIKIAVTEFYKPYLFTKTDLELMSKAKRNDKMANHELNYWHNGLKEKSKELVLLKEADLLGINGKYNKRLYTLLGQFKKSGKYICKVEKFRKILEIPSSYRMYDIDRNILTPARKELKEKTGINITEIKKIKVKRSIDKLEFYFKYTKQDESNKPVQQTILGTDQPKIDKKDSGVISDEIVQLKSKIKVKLKGKHVLLAELIPVMTIEGLREFATKHEIEIE